MNPKLLLTFCFSALLILSCGCTSDYSLREAGIRGHIPDSFKNHIGGITVSPTEYELEAALAFGLSCKDRPETLEYAYIRKAGQGALSNDLVYVSVYTPLRLVAHHAVEQARAYKPIDSGYISYLRSLKAVKIEVTQQYMSSATYKSYAFSRQLVLLRDGIRVEPLKSIASWHGVSPFPNKADEMLAAIYAAMPGGNPNESTSGDWSDVELREDDSVFSVDDVNQPGSYEIVIQEPKTSVLGPRRLAELKIPISFSVFR